MLTQLGIIQANITQTLLHRSITHAAQQAINTFLILLGNSCLDTVGVGLAASDLISRLDAAVFYTNLGGVGHQSALEPTGGDRIATTRSSYN